MPLSSSLPPRANRLIRFWMTLDAPRDDHGHFFKEEGAPCPHTSRGTGNPDRQKTASEDVTSEYKKNARPGFGTITAEPGYKVSKHKNEIMIAQWIHDKFGGNIVLLKESSEHGVKTPDFLWDGLLWELKTPESPTQTAFENCIHAAIKQIRPKPGGIILNLNGCGADIKDAEAVIKRRMMRSAEFSCDVLILQKGDEYKVLRFK